MTTPLHADDPAASAVLPDGRTVKNLTVEEYNATFEHPGITLHGVPTEVLSKILDELP